MLSLEKNGYSEQEIIKALHSNREISIKYNLLNKYDMNIGQLEIPQYGNNIEMNSLAEIKRIGNFTVKENELNDIDWLNDRIQPVFCLKMPNGFVEWSLGIFLISSPAKMEVKGQIYRNIEAYDSSLILKEDKFDNRYMIRSGTNYIDAITDIINSSFINKVHLIDKGYRLAKDKEFEIGTTKLEAINVLLKEINYTSIFVDENGFFTSGEYILPINKNVDYSYRNNDVSIIYPGAKKELDLFNVPNIWIITATNPESIPLTSKYKNDSIVSMTSTYKRKRNIVKIVKLDNILDQATLDNYTQKIVFEDSQVYEKTIFETALMPHHSYNDLLFIDHSNLGIATNYIETRWTMDLKIGGRMKHECRKVVNI